MLDVSNRGSLKDYHPGLAFRRAISPPFYPLFSAKTSPAQATRCSGQYS